MAAQEEFHLGAMDIRAAFVQVNNLDMDVFIVPLADIKKEGVLWKLIKPLYGQKDASRKFWQRMNFIFKEVGLKTVAENKAFYYKHGKKGANTCR